MNIFFYCIIFTMGILFGSFYTLAVYRIPKRQDITHTHSYCPNCNAKLGFFELIPVFSYIFLKGKCKHCGEKIRVRYILLEILSGITFVLMAMGMNLNVYTVTIMDGIKFLIYALYITFIFLIAGIDKENRVIEKSVIYYGIIISNIYMIYLYILGECSIYRYVIYLLIMEILLIIDYFYYKKNTKYSYVIGNILLLLIMNVFTYENITLITTELALISIAAYLIINKTLSLKNKTIAASVDKLSIGFYLCVSNCLSFLTLINIFNI